VEVVKRMKLDSDRATIKGLYFCCTFMLKTTRNADNLNNATLSVLVFSA